MYMKVLDHVMPREKRCPSSGQLFPGLLGLISRAYSNFSLWHHEHVWTRFIRKGRDLQSVKLFSPQTILCKLGYTGSLGVGDDLPGGRGEELEVEPVDDGCHEHGVSVERLRGVGPVLIQDRHLCHVTLLTCHQGMHLFNTQCLFQGVGCFWFSHESFRGWGGFWFPHESFRGWGAFGSPMSQFAYPSLE